MGGLALRKRGRGFANSSSKSWCDASFRELRYGSVLASLSNGHNDGSNGYNVAKSWVSKATRVSKGYRNRGCPKAMWIEIVGVQSLCVSKSWVSKAYV